VNDVYNTELAEGKLNAPKRKAGREERRELQLSIGPLSLLRTFEPSLEGKGSKKYNL